MKYNIVTKATSDGVKLDRYIQIYIRRYLDETNKADLPFQFGRTDVPEVPLVRGVDYYSIYPKGKITVCGYLEKYVAMVSGKVPEEIAKDDLPTFLARAIRAAAIKIANKNKKPIRPGAKVLAKFSFAVSRKMTEQWRAAGVDPDAALIRIIRDTLRRFSLATLNGEPVGFAIGIHHDRRHVHGHVLLMLRTELGTELMLNNKGHIKFLSIITNTANLALRDYNLARTRPIYQTTKASPYNLDNILAPLMAIAARDRNVQDPDAELEALHAMTADQLIPVLDDVFYRYLPIHKRITALKPELREQASERSINEILNLFRQMDAEETALGAVASRARRTSYQAEFEFYHATRIGKAAPWFFNYSKWRGGGYDHDREALSPTTPSRTI